MLQIFIVYMYILSRLISNCYCIKKKKTFCTLLIILFEFVGCIAALWIFKNYFVTYCVQEGLESVAMMLASLYCK